MPDIEIEQFRREARAWLEAKGLDYLPVIFPGYSFHNASGGNARLDEIPRASASLSTLSITGHWAAGR